MTNVKVDKQEFIKALTIGGAFAGRVKTLPILNCVKIKVSNGTLKVTSSDSDNAINKSINVISADSDTAFCVDHDDLLSYVKCVSDDTLGISVDDNNVEISHNIGKMSFPVSGVQDFPVLKRSETVNTVSVSAPLIKEWIYYGKRFTDNSDIRPQMNGIYFYSKGGEIGCCASDGHCLFCDHYDSDIEDFSFILNKTAFNAVCDACDDVEELTVMIGNGNVMFVGNGNGTAVLTKLLEGAYPNFKMVIPSNPTIKINADRKELIQSINRCSKANSQLVKFDCDGCNNLNITSRDLDFNISAEENVSVEANEGIKIGFQADNIQKILNSISSEKCTINITASERPVTITDNDDPNKVFLIMPVLLNENE